MKLTQKEKTNLKNKDWRLSHLYKIKDKQGKLVSFTRNKAQIDFNSKRHTRNIILKSRQLGFTTDEAIDMFDDVLFTRNYDSMFIAQDLDTAKDIFSNKVDLAWNNFKLKELYRPDTSSARQVKLNFGDDTFSSITVDTTGRSGTFQRLHITEFAQVCKKFPDKAREILEGSIPAVPMHGRVDIESTAEGSEGKFYDMFWTAWDRGNPVYPTEFKSHFYNWQWDHAELSRITEEQIRYFKSTGDYLIFKEYQQQHKLSDLEITYYYLKWLSLEKDWNSMKKEYPTTPYEAFEGSGNKLFDSTKLSLMNLVPGKRIGDWTYFGDYQIGHRYAAGCDVAEGVGRDSNACVIWDFTPIKPRVVAEYKSNKIAPDLFAYEIKDGCSKYGMAFVAVERNNHGHSTISKLKEIYPEKYIYKDEKDKLGWQTNLVTKPKMMYDLNTAVNNELIDIPSQALVNEARRYDKEELNTGKFDDESTQHWDLLVAASIGFQMRDKLPMGSAKGFTQYKPGGIKIL